MYFSLNRRMENVVLSIVFRSCVLHVDLAASSSLVQVFRPLFAWKRGATVPTAATLESRSHGRIDMLKGYLPGLYTRVITRFVCTDAPVSVNRGLKCAHAFVIRIVVASCCLATVFVC